ncbi:hypothetical protein GCM10010377_51710 [Streptomyces viridiviolaceus]|nr:hypothetical protein GCM10010377_51710 [Streptomyces viridiviolaceus]
MENPARRNQAGALQPGASQITPARHERAGVLIRATARGTLGNAPTWPWPDSSRACPAVREANSRRCVPARTAVLLPHRLTDGRLPLQHAPSRLSPSDGRRPRAGHRTRPDGLTKPRAARPAWHPCPDPSRVTHAQGRCAKAHATARHFPPTAPGRRVALEAIRLSLPAPQKLRFLPGRKTGVSTKES